MKNTVVYYIALGQTIPGKEDCGDHRKCVRAVYMNGKTRTWYPDTRGYQSALARCKASNKRR